MSIAFVVLKLEGGGQIDTSPGVTGSRNSPGGIGLKSCSFHKFRKIGVFCTAKSRRVGQKLTSYSDSSAQKTLKKVGVVICVFQNFYFN